MLKMQNNSRNLETVFKVVYIIHLLLAFNGLVNRTPVTKITLLFTLVLGGIVGIQKVFAYKKFMKKINFWLLNGFIVSYIISMVFNYKYGFIDNLQGLVWLLAEIWILYLVDEEKNIKKEFELLSKTMIVCVSIGNIISLGMYFIGYSAKNEVAGRMKFLGFHWGRLWGIYDDPNHGAIIASLAVILALYFCIAYTVKRWPYWISIAVQCSYIILSDSRTGILCLSIGTGLVLALLYLNRAKKVGWNICISIAIFIGTISLVSITKIPLQNGFGQVGTFTVKLVQSFERENGEDGNEDESSEELEVGRREKESDPSNRRFDLWKSGAEIFMSKPLIGVSWQNVTAYAEEELPDTYLVNNDFQKFASFHNMPVDVLAGQGIFGIAILIAVFIRSIVFFIKSCRNITAENMELMIIIFSILIISVFASLLVSSIFYINSPESFIFWLCFGYFIALMDGENRKRVI